MFAMVSRNGGAGETNLAVHLAACAERRVSRGMIFERSPNGAVVGRPVTGSAYRAPAGWRGYWIAASNGRNAIGRQVVLPVGRRLQTVSISECRALDRAVDHQTCRTAKASFGRLRDRSTFRIVRRVESARHRVVD